MKLYKTLTVLALSIMLLSCNEEIENKEIKLTDTVNKIEVIDFHSTHRCMTCNAIEANTKYTLETYFANELKDGIITFQSVNVDEEKNYNITEKYEATGTSLFLNIVINGSETILDITDFAFSKARDSEAFSKSLKIKIEEQLKKI